MISYDRTDSSRIAEWIYVGCKGVQNISLKVTVLSYKFDILRESGVQMTNSQPNKI